MAARTNRTPKRREWARAFLARLEAGDTITDAAAAVKVARSTVYERREHDEAFAAEWDAVIESSTELMEQEAYRRAVSGWTERKLFDGEGREIGEVRKYSDTLLIFMLKARRPDVYRENHRVQHVGPDGGPLGVELRLDDVGREALASVLRQRPASRGE